jgi:hypothetical protein
MDSCAVTDHGVLYGAIDFYTAMTEAGLKPIIGCEAYVCRNRLDKSLAGRENSHLILLCENNTGYQNLMYLISEGFLTGYYYKPRIDYDLIRQHHEGLICLSACLSGDLPKLLLNGQEESARAYVREMQEIFGEDHFYIELMDHHLRDEKTVRIREILCTRCIFRPCSVGMHHGILGILGDIIAVPDPGIMHVQCDILFLCHAPPQCQRVLYLFGHSVAAFRRIRCPAGMTLAVDLNEIGTDERTDFTDIFLFQGQTNRRSAGIRSCVEVKVQTEGAFRASFHIVFLLFCKNGAQISYPI